MKLLDKLKNTFFEEEYVEVEEPEVKPQPVAKKVETVETKKEEKKPTILEQTKETISEENFLPSKEEISVQKDNKIPYFEDDDFIDADLKDRKKDEPKKLYGESSDKLYDSISYNGISSNKPYSNPSREGFKPTPIISPIYGILDKNYRKDEVIDKKDRSGTHSSYVSRKNADLDTVRQKAFGGLEPLEGIHPSTSIVEGNAEDTNTDNLLYDMTDDNSTPVVDKVTIADAEEYFDDLGLEYNIDYKDNRYEKATGRRISSNKKIENTENTDDTEEANLDDNLFDIIDSMYEESEE